MASNLLDFAATATRRAFEEAASTWLESRGEKLEALLSSKLPTILASASGLFAVQFSLAVLRQLLHPEDTERKMRLQMARLIGAPAKTALEQFRIASGLRPINDDESAHRESRFRECLGNLDLALSVADSEDVPVINLLRGVCALHIRGGSGEARQHLIAYAADCRGQGDISRREAALHRARASEYKAEADRIRTDPGPGVGGGLVGMAVAEPRIRKAALLERSNSEVRLAEQRETRGDEFERTAAYVIAVAETAGKPASSTLD